MHRRSSEKLFLALACALCACGAAQARNTFAAHVRVTGPFAFVSVLDRSSDAADHVERYEDLLALPLSTNGTSRTLDLTLPRAYLDECVGSFSVARLSTVDLPPDLTGPNAPLFNQRGAFWYAMALAHDVEPDEDAHLDLPAPPESGFALERTGSNVWFVLDAPAPEPEPIARVKSANAFRILWDASADFTAQDRARIRPLLAVLPKHTYYSLIVFRERPEAEIFLSSGDELMSTLDGVAHSGHADYAALADAVRPLSFGARVTTLLITSAQGRAAGALDFGPHKPFVLETREGPADSALFYAAHGRMVDVSHTTLDHIAWEILHPARRVVGVRGVGLADCQGVGQVARGRVAVLGRMTARRSVIRLDFGDGHFSTPLVMNAKDAQAGSVLARAHAAGLGDAFLAWRQRMSASEGAGGGQSR